MQAVKARSHSGNASGFTLVELMVVVLIVGILASIAVPSYVSYVVRANRGAAKACASEYAQFMERYYTTNLTYVGAAPVLGCATESGLDRNYTFSATAVAPTQRTYTITVTPINAQLARDTYCGTLTVDQAGTRTDSGSQDVAYCW